LANKQERMTLSEKERDRLKVLHEVKQGHLKQRQGAEQVGMSERAFRKLLKRFRKSDDWAVVHALRDRRSNRGIGEETATKAVEAEKREYRDFAPTLAAEYLDKDLQISLSRETLRQLMIRGRTREGEDTEDQRGTRVATAAQLPGRTGAVGHQCACLAGRPGTRQDVSDRVDR
jgi:DNA-binding Lrp family transcriptional regulator